MLRPRAFAVSCALAVLTAFAACATYGDESGDGEHGPKAFEDDGAVETSSAADAGPDAPAPRGAHLFSRSFGGPEEDYLTQASVDLSGNLLVAGSFGSATIDFGSGALTNAGALDMYFAKFDPAGKNVFASSFGDDAGQNGVSLVGTGSGELYATGAFSGTVHVGGTDVTATDGQFDALVMRLGGDGSFKEKFVVDGSGRQFVNGITYDGSRGVFFSGFNNGQIPGPPIVTTQGGNDVLIGHGASTQNWLRQFGDASEQFGGSVAYDPAGSLVALGYFGGTIAFGDGPTWTSAGGYDLYVVRLSIAGDPIWSRAFGATGDQQAGPITIAAGAIFIGGTFSGTFTLGNDLVSAGGTDAFIAKLAADGTPMWSKRFGGAANDEIGSIAIAANGDIVISGRSYGDLDLGTGALPPAGDADAFLARLDKDGNAIWAKRFGDGGFQSINSCGVTPSNEVWVAGYYTGSIDLGGGPLVSQGKHDIFIARFSP